MSLPDAVLLDTCAVIWLANGNPLAPAALSAVEHARRRQGVFVLPVSASEGGC
jgi:PIN domain nuclease of toxin-antitoxin system